MNRPNTVKAGILKNADFMYRPGADGEVHSPAPAMPKRHGCARNVVLGEPREQREDAVGDLVSICGAGWSSAGRA
jgi:hypothetical protein